MINTDLIIICATFLAAFYLHTRVVSAARLPTASTVSRDEENELDPLNIFDLDSPADAPQTSANTPPQKEETIDFDNLSAASDDLILREMSLIENRSEKPKTMSIVEKKQLLAYQIHKRRLHTTAK